MAWSFYNSSGVAKTGEYSGSAVTQVLHVRDEKANTTAGGTFTSGAWRTRDLNTVKTNAITGASVASNQITLPVGTYWIEASAPARRVDEHKAKLYNTTAAADVIIGTNEYTIGSADTASTRSLVRGAFTLTATSVLELQHRCLTTLATNGFGLPTAFSVVEVYSEVMIWKTA